MALWRSHLRSNEDVERLADFVLHLLDLAPQQRRNLEHGLFRQLTAEICQGAIGLRKAVLSESPNGPISHWAVKSSMRVSLSSAVAVRLLAINFYLIHELLLHVASDLDDEEDTALDIDTLVISVVIVFFYNFLPSTNDTLKFNPSQTLFEGLQLLDGLLDRELATAKMNEALPLFLTSLEMPVKLFTIKLIQKITQENEELVTAMLQFLESESTPRLLVAGAQTLYAILDKFSSTAFIGRVTSLCLRYSHHVNTTVASRYWSLLQNIHPISIQRSTLQLPSNERFLKLQNAIEKAPFSSSFRQQHFSLLLRYFVEPCSYEISSIESERPPTPEDDEISLVRLFHSALGGRVIAKTLQQENHDPFYHLDTTPLLKYWSVWEMSKFCILSRFRTITGSPTTTLELFETHIRHIQSILHSDASKSLQQSQPFRESVYDFLVFLDVFERHVCATTWGTVVGCLAIVPSKPAIQFVRDNRSVCEQWFARIRPIMVDVALHLPKLERIGNTLDPMPGLCLMQAMRGLVEFSHDEQKSDGLLYFEKSGRWLFITLIRISC